MRVLQIQLTGDYLRITPQALRFTYYFYYFIKGINDINGLFCFYRYRPSITRKHINGTKKHLYPSFSSAVLVKSAKSHWISSKKCDGTYVLYFLYVNLTCLLLSLSIYCLTSLYVILESLSIACLYTSRTEPYPVTTLW